MKKITQGFKNSISPRQAYLLLIPVLLLPVITSLLMGRAQAATLTNTYVRLNRMKTGTATSFRIVFTNITNGTNSVVVDFNSNNPIGAAPAIDQGTARWTDAANGGLIGATGSQTASIATCPGESGAAAMPGTLTASSSGSTVTVATSTTMSATTAYCVDLTFASAVTTPTTAGEYHPSVTTKTGASATDSTNVALRIIANDQVTVNAVVPPTFNFVLSAVTDNFTANLSTTSVVSSGGVTVTLTTNAPNGWVVWAKDFNSSGGKGALNSATATYKITSPSAIGSAAHSLATACAPNCVEDYGLASTITTDAAGGCTVVLDAAYNGAGSQAGVLDPSILRPIAACNTGTANGDIITVAERATVSGQTPAASDYSDVITLVGAGRF